MKKRYQICYRKIQADDFTPYTDASIENWYYDLTECLDNFAVIVRRHNAWHFKVFVSTPFV